MELKRINIINVIMVEFLYIQSNENKNVKKVNLACNLYIET